MSYKAPIDDMKFVLKELLSYAELANLPGLDDIDDDTADMLLEMIDQYTQDVLVPLNSSGDKDGGCEFDAKTNEVKTPAGSKEAYEQFTDMELTALTCDPKYGGQGLPFLLNAAGTEILSSGSMWFTMYPGLTHGVYTAVEAFGSEELKDKWLPDLVSGKTAGTMCLTEPHCGSDLAMVKSTATPVDAGFDENKPAEYKGAYKIKGTKIFISGGDQDLTDNIAHLVLARLPGAPEGTKGISLFLVPKFTDEDGTKTRNDVKCVSIEHKLGIKGNATCTMQFDGAVGYLVGKPHEGMKNMFAMMNEARLGVAMQGLSQIELAYQSAVERATERRQMRALNGPAEPNEPADKIIVHPEVRKGIMTMKALSEGGRALNYFTAKQLDIAHRHPDTAEAKKADKLVQILTPVLKAFMTDAAVEAANTNIQIHGGEGYVEETGVTQYLRDARITPIYEGTNGIQALDLVGRKLAHDFMKHAANPKDTLFANYTLMVREDIEAAKQNPKLAEFIAPVEEAMTKLEDVTGHVLGAAMQKKNMDELGAASTDYLKMFGLVATGHMWLRMAEVAQERLDEGANQPKFYETKLKTARFYMEKLLPQINGLEATIKTGAESLMEIDEDELTHANTTGFAAVSRPSKRGGSVSVRKDKNFTPKTP